MKWRPHHKPQILTHHPHAKPSMETTAQAHLRDDIGQRIERVEREMDAALRDAGAVRREAELTAQAIRRELGLPAPRGADGIGGGGGVGGSGTDGIGGGGEQGKERERK